MLQEMRSVYLEERCTLRRCGGKVHRVLLGGMLPPGEGGEESYPVSQAYDRCDTCLELLRRTGVVQSPAWYSAAALFGQWEAHEIDRAEFDRLVGKLFENAGSGWNVEVS